MKRTEQQLMQRDVFYCDAETSQGWPCPEQATWVSEQTGRHYCTGCATNALASEDIEEFSAIYTGITPVSDWRRAR